MPTSGAREVAITGLGAVTALGPDVRTLAAGLIEGRCAIGPLTLFSHAGRCRIAAEVPEAIAMPLATIAPATARRLSRADRFAVAASAEACRDAGLDEALRRGAALAVGATTGGMRETEEAYRRRRAGEDRRFRLGRMLGTALSTSAAAVSQALGIFGPRATFSTACSSSALAIAAAVETIRAGRTPLALAVGTDQLCRLTYAGFDALQALDPEPCRPFDGRRRGLSLGEGAAALVLEDAAHARARGARVHALVLGHGTATDAHHPTAPHPAGAGAVAALRAALADAGVSPERIDYVNAHGSGTPQNDAVEVAVLRTVLGRRLPWVPVSSTKSQLGHTLGAAGAIEAVVTVRALADGIVPPTVNLRAPDPAWADLDLATTPGRRAALEVAVTSSYGFGGHNVTLVLARAGVR
ncbi:MAG TPA: beta-ketoacyl-[acyl-carrier-protein] synthase family protein [Candidatus Binatia bacterium]|nr:beta-ketoacyl-[acyl-carrier-protein] synthase family protein [Candidatus Binatia bacterium]